MNRSFLSIAVSVLFGAMALSCQSAAADPSNDLAFQMRLVRDGFLKGPTDGQIGPATRKAITEYAEKFQVKNSRESVELDMLRRAANARGTLIDESIWEAATKAASTLLRDPFSARFTQLYYFKGSDGTSVVCGLVNAKNLYGAYTGDQFFQASIIDLVGSPIGVASLEAERTCEFGVSLADFRQ